ncbi:MAG: squalene synthase HpnC [Sulfuricella sp.]|nr:squalene synthase HpnC [Sulfuricella sp.]
MPQHYENFPVASVLLPKRLRHPVSIIYAFARAADDFADEGDLEDATRLSLLSNFRSELDGISAGIAPTTPLFVDLAEIVAHHHLPLQPFYDLLNAFSQDVTTKRYANLGEVMNYCQRSANPVGLLLLHLYGAATERNIGYSNAICSSLQLINFLQDIAIDYHDKNRIYLPQDELAKYGIAEAQIARGDCGGLWKPFMLSQIERTRKLLQAGAPLGTILHGRIGLEMRMIIMGGETILRKLHKSGGDIFNHRPMIKSGDWIYMLYRALRKK